MRLAGIAILLAAIYIIPSCNTVNSVGEKQGPQKPTPGESRATSTPPLVEESIRSVDFRNFTYPVCLNVKPEILPKTKSITLRNGELEIAKGTQGNSEPLNISLSNVSFGDLTKDGNEEAIVTLITLLYPHGSTACTYVYTWKENKVQLLWSYAFGTDAFGGLRRLSVEDGNLIVEEYVSSSSAALCCPEKFSRSIYRWNAKSFEKIKSEVFVNESKRNDILGYPDNHTPQR